MAKEIVESWGPKKERCRVCGKKVRVQIQKNTGFCSAKCYERWVQEWACDRGPCWKQRGHEGRCDPGPGRDVLEEAVDTVRDAEET